MQVIYLDVLLVLNLFIDFLLLMVTARILRQPHRRLRLVLGALFGSASSCLIFLPDLHPLVNFLIDTAAALLIIRIAFRWQNRMVYIKEVVVFFVVSALFGGIAYAVWYFIAPSGFYVANGVVYYNVSPLTLVALTVISYFVITIYDRVTHKKIAEGHDYRLLIDCGGGTASVRALYDTGHHVTDIFTGSPVAIVSLPSLLPYLKEELRGTLSASLSNEFTAPDKASAAAAVQTHLRMIPYQTVSGTGLLPAFRPDHVSLLGSQGRQADITGTFVAVCRVLGRGEYEAIIGTDIVGLLEGSKASCATCGK